MKLAERRSIPEATIWSPKKMVIREVKLKWAHPLGLVVVITWILHNLISVISLQFTEGQPRQDGLQWSMWVGHGRLNSPTVDFTACVSHFSFENAARLLESADMYTIFIKTKNCMPWVTFSGKRRPGCESIYRDRDLTILTPDPRLTPHRGKTSLGHRVPCTVTGES